MTSPEVTPSNARPAKRRRTLSITEDSDERPQLLQTQPPPLPLTAPETPPKRTTARSASSSPLSSPPQDSPSQNRNQLCLRGGDASPDGPFVIGFDPTANDPYTDTPGSGSGKTSVNRDGGLNKYPIPSGSSPYDFLWSSQRKRNSASPTSEGRGARVGTRSMTRMRNTRRKRARRFSAEVARRHEVERSKFGLVEVGDMERLSLHGNSEEDPEEAPTVRKDVNRGTTMRGRDNDREMEDDSSLVGGGFEEEERVGDTIVVGTPYPPYQQVVDGGSIVVRQ
ncbi:hypothetical protein B0T14DRAFT_564090 [Immersiella caudata]|uniref:Uncharacterized protein n=1 Tax=Immersiella caudata TaxID=314043 RepID=A0AA40C368_9PEZI|nr:hypothetical protein B0T14DRAFT_564090 [Immersiella caudata]